MNVDMVRRHSSREARGGKSIGLGKGDLSRATQAFPLKIGGDRSRRNAEIPTWPRRSGVAIRSDMHSHQPEILAETRCSRGTPLGIVVISYAQPVGSHVEDRPSGELQRSAQGMHQDEKRIAAMVEEPSEKE
jgi:hypothetical protein